MKPSFLQSRIFLDSGDSDDTKKTLDMLGFLDGQTTNPTLVAKKLTVSGTDLKLTEEALLYEYRKIVEEISKLIPTGSVSIEVYADKTTTADQMMLQAREMYAWIPNAHIKFPTTYEGLKAAQEAIAEGLRVNMTLVFSLQQAAAVYVATLGAKKGDVFISPFIGRLDDQGQNGMDLIKNIAKLYETSDHHVEILSASIRSIDHFYGSIAAGADILTCPMAVLTDWIKEGMKIQDENYVYRGVGKPIPFEVLDLTKPWNLFDIKHELTDKGLEKFAADWNALIEKT